MPYNKDQFYATVAPRPRKIAFIVNPNNCPHDLLDSIYEFNISHWGGRYNPIIPVIDGKIDDSYWDLLKFSDPDIIYTYAWLSKALVDRIDRDISPFHFVVHRNSHHDENNPYKYKVDLPGQIAAKMLYPMFNKVFKQDPFSNPKLFIYNGGKKNADYRLIMRNFGVINDRALNDRVSQEIAMLKIDENLSLDQIIKIIAEAGSLVTPIQLSENSAGY